MFGKIVLGIVMFLLASFIAVAIAEELMMAFLGKDLEDSDLEACLDKICKMIKRKIYEIRYGKKDRIELEYDEFTGVWSWGR